MVGCRGGGVLHQNSKISTFLQFLPFRFSWSVLVFFFFALNSFCRSQETLIDVGRQHDKQLPPCGAVHVRKNLLKYVLFITSLKNELSLQRQQKGHHHQFIRTVHKILKHNTYN